jgi:LmbE family N-acetylglucosaminyl deacetylase
VDILVISAHADDETLGCGGTILRHRREGDRFHWLVLTEPATGRWTPEVTGQKAAQIEHVAEMYGAADVVRPRLPQGQLDAIAFESVMSAIEEAVEKTRPEVVYLVNDGDVHTDHSVAARAASSVLKPFHMRHLGVRRILAYETLSSTEAAATPSFAPTVYIDISDTMERKLEVLAAYETELQTEFLPRTVSAARALARYRGATVAVEYAEAFVLVRQIV